jgi:hypothetical protein
VNFVPWNEIPKVFAIWLQNAFPAASRPNRQGNCPSSQTATLLPLQRHVISNSIAGSFFEKSLTMYATHNACDFIFASLVLRIWEAILPPPTLPLTGNSTGLRQTH